MTPMSPVWNHPSFGTSAVFSRSFVVAHHHVGALDQNLAVVGDFHVHAIGEFAHAANLQHVVAVRRVHADHRRGLREAVAFQDRDAGPVEEAGKAGLRAAEPEATAWMPLRPRASLTLPKTSLRARLSLTW